MGLLKSIASIKRKHRKKKVKKEEEKYNHRQEEMDSIYKKKKQKSDFKTLLSRLKFETYTKRLVGLVVFISLLDLQLSYVLAFLDKTQIAESLSNQICVTLLGTVLVYMIRAYFDTKAEKRDEMIKSGLIVDKKSQVIPKEILENKIREIIDNTGVGEYISTTEYDDSCELETENPDDE